MIKLVANSDFTLGWLERKNGDGVVTVANDILHCSGTGTSQAMRDFCIPVLPGQRIKIEIMARKITGTPRIGIDFFDQAFNYTILDYVEVTSTEWNTYQLSVMIPVAGVTKGFVRCAFGKWNSHNDSIEVEYQDPKFYTDLGLGTDLIIAMGLLQINNGIPSIHPGFRQFGVSSVVTEDANTVKVILSTPIINTIDVSSNNILMKPNMQISGTPEYPIIPLAGTFSPASTEPPFFRVRFSNGTTLLNLTGLNAYASFKLSY